VSAPCPACGSPTRRRYLPLDRATLAVCGTCGHGVTSSCARRIGLEEYASAPAERAAYEREYLPARLRSYERGLELLGPAEGRLLLDVGSNYGHFLAVAARRGWRTLGVEPGVALRAHAVNGTVGAAVSSLEEAAALAPFDAVTLWDVLEHLPSPHRYLERLAELLVPGGRLLLRVPDARVFGALRSSPAWRVLEQPYLTLCHPTNPEEHLTHFTPVSVSRVARGAGLRELARLDARYDERVFAAKTPLDAGVRRALHRAGRRLPYEFTMLLERTGAG
jgi:SAM-dependent methyltransferase